ncbi:MAG: efflux RND transporter periplasmic adaptor subunit [Chloroherpetonaceae bacterium]|nr:efflux RND transporter periplasmic adaptor subunit [Chloroherpetonaceae bacterium]
MRNKLIAFGAIAVLIAAIIYTLQHNKSISEAKAEASQETERAITVSTGQIQRSSFTEALSIVGTTIANNDVPLISETQGRVTAVFAKVGDFRNSGSVVIQVDDEVKKANYETARVSYEKSKKDLDRYEELFRQNAISVAQIEQFRYATQSAESQYIIAKRAYSDTKITTPISGYLTERKVDVGAYISQGMLIGNVVDISRLKVKVLVTESDVFKLKEGDKVTIDLDVFPGKQFEGRIQSISAKGDEAHTFPVEIMIENRDRNYPLKAGMFAKVNFESLKNRDALMVPREALIGSVKNPQVFVVEENIAKLRSIVVGRESGKNLEVLSGLKEGETVVVSGQNNLREGYSVVAISK